MSYPVNTHLQCNPGNTTGGVAPLSTYFQWELGGIPINGATNSDYIPLTAGQLTCNQIVFDSTYTSISAETVSVTIDTAISFLSASINLDQLTVTLSNSAVLTDATGFSLSGNTMGGSVSALYVSGTNPLLFTTTLSAAGGETVLLNYTSVTDGIEDSAGNDLPSIVNEVVINNTVEPSGIGFDKTSLIGWWDLAGDFVNQDNPGTLDAEGVNAPTFTTGPFSDASGALLGVNAGNKHARIPHAAALNPSDDVSMSFWADSTTVGMFASKYGSAGDRSWQVNWQGSTNDRIQLILSDDGTNMESETSGSGDFLDGTGWVHVVLTYKLSTNTVNMYNNGVLVHTGTYATETGAIFASTAPLRLLSSDGISSLGSAIARFSFWGRELTGAEAAVLYNTGLDLKYADL